MRWQLSAGQWDVLAELLRVENYPVPLQLRIHGNTDIERGWVRSQMTDELSRLGLLRGGRVEPDLEAALRVLHRPVCWIDSVWLPEASAGQPVRVVVAGSPQGGVSGVCALQHPDQPGTTQLEVIPAGGLAPAVVRTLPPHPPGHNPAVTVALKPMQLSEPQPGRSLLVSASNTPTSAQRDKAAAAAILEGPPTRFGQIAANLRDSAGRVRRSEILSWCDNPDGRYQMTIRNQTDGSRWLTVGPADPQRLAEGVQRLLTSVQPR